MAERLISLMFIKRQKLNVPASHPLRGRSISAAVAIRSVDGEDIEPMAVIIGEAAARSGETDDVVCRSGNAESPAAVCCDRLVSALVGLSS